MAATLKIRMLATLFVMAVALSGARVSAQTHHVVGGWGPESDVSSWLSGRVFRVGDKIWFKAQESILELKDLENFESCDLTNPIRMYTDRESPVDLENEGVRYFTSADPDRCKNGLKLPVFVEPFPESEPSPPFDPHPSHGPPPHVDPPHKYGPPPPAPYHPGFEPPHPSYGPPPHVEPPHRYGPPPPPPDEPQPARVPPPPPHRPPSGAANLSGLSFVLLAGLFLCYVGM